MTRFVVLLSKKWHFFAPRSVCRSLTDFHDKIHSLFFSILGRLFVYSFIYSLFISFVFAILFSFWHWTKFMFGVWAFPHFFIGKRFPSNISYAFGSSVSIADFIFRRLFPPKCKQWRKLGRHKHIPCWKIGSCICLPRIY